MNRKSYSLCRKTLWLTLAVVGISGLNLAGGTETEGRLAQAAGEPTGPPAVSPLSPTAPPELVKPALPSEIQSAESVLRKLDVTRKGYVTLDDTKDLIGFEGAFRKVDSKDSGKLTPAQFRKAWSIYRSGK